MKSGLTIVERARRYIAKCPPAISGQRGHDATFHVAAVLVNGFGLSETEALMLLKEWNASCVPPWSEAELVHKTQSAAGTEHSEPRGHLLNCKMQNGELGRERTGITSACRVEVPSSPRVRPQPRAERAPKPAFCPMVLKRVAAKAGAVGDV